MLPKWPPKDFLSPKEPSQYTVNQSITGNLKHMHIANNIHCSFPSIPTVTYSCLSTYFSLYIKILVTGRTAWGNRAFTVTLTSANGTKSPQNGSFPACDPFQPAVRVETSQQIYLRFFLLPFIPSSASSFVAPVL